MYYTNFSMVECKRCLIIDELLHVKIKDLLDLMTVDEKVPDEIYSQRLDICQSCDNLITGTCIQCGCFVELRAARSNQRCPIKKWERER